MAKELQPVAKSALKKKERIKKTHRITRMPANILEEVFNDYYIAETIGAYFIITLIFEAFTTMLYFALAGLIPSVITSILGWATLLPAVVPGFFLALAVLALILWPVNSFLANRPEAEISGDLESAYELAAQGHLVGSRLIRAHEVNPRGFELLASQIMEVYIDAQRLHSEPVRSEVSAVLTTLADELPSTADGRRYAKGQLTLTMNKVDKLLLQQREAEERASKEVEVSEAHEIETLFSSLTPVFEEARDLQ